MNENSCISVPSPAEIQNLLFSNPGARPPVLPETWSATALLTPFGGLNASAPLSSSDELVAARIYYANEPSSNPYLRVRLYLLESLLYYDFYFVTSGGQTLWYWLISDPSDPSPDPPHSEAFGPYSTPTQLPPTTFLGDRGFSYTGTWNVVNQSCDGYSAGANMGMNAGTWYSFLSQTNILSRIMNVDNTNDFNIPVLGAYYLVNFPTFTPLPPMPSQGAELLSEVTASSSDNGPSQMVTLQDIQTAMVNPPSGASQMACTPADIAAVIPGLSVPQSQPTPPAWTNQVQSFCYMMGQDSYPYFCEVYYDYTVNQAQVSVFVTQDTSGTYDSRQDELLPRGTVGPAVNYAWNQSNSQWDASCIVDGGSVVPMPVPNFVQAGGGRCRAVIENNPYFGPDNVTIWSVMLGDQSSWADFWYWFDSQNRGVVFSLAPASSLTMIDYQTFLQNPNLPSCIFAEPESGLPSCGTDVISRRQKFMLMPKGGFHTY